MSKKGKQIKAHLNDEEAESLSKVRARYGFKSDYQFVLSCVRLFLRILSDPRREEFNGSDYDYIEHLFTEYANAEYEELYPTPESSINRLQSNIRYRSGDDIKKKDKTQQSAKEVRYKEFADRFIRTHYKRLQDTFDGMRINRANCEAMDICQDTLLALYYCREEFSSYEDFEQYALEKFHLS
ncbi:hypothetical protein [Porphyromonas gingivicanis]|uniref:hypothetical protein n=1 Tax=Porphyromonas gingivicanis TaxID=266762 RepID=UPI00046F895B|nr:hypothetical protein [Porphyromonas gingivicanis]